MAGSRIRLAESGYSILASKTCTRDNRQGEFRCYPPCDSSDRKCPLLYDDRRKRLRIDRNAQPRVRERCRPATVPKREIFVREQTAELMALIRTFHVSNARDGARPVASGRRQNSGFSRVAYKLIPKSGRMRAGSQ